MDYQFLNFIVECINLIEHYNLAEINWEISYEYTLHYSFFFPKYVEISIENSEESVYKHLFKNVFCLYTYSVKRISPPYSYLNAKWQSQLYRNYSRILSENQPNACLKLFKCFVTKVSFSWGFFNHTEQWLI